MRGLAAVWCLVISVAAASPASAADEVDELMKRGTDLRRVGRDAEALAEFQKALRLRPTPRATAQVAMAEQALGLWVEANLHIGQALEKESDPWIKKNHSTLEAARSTIQKHLCRIDFWGAPDGAELSIDGKRVGILPNTQVWVLPGEIAFEAKAPGFTAFHRTMKTPEGTVIREHVQLRAAQPEPPPQVLAAAAPPAKTPPSPASTITVAPPPAEPVTLVSQPSEPGPPTSASETSVWSKWWVWTLIGAGVLAAGGTTWLLTHRSSQSCDREPCTTWN